MEFLKKHFWLLLSLFVAALAGRMLLTSSHFHIHDDIQVFRVNEYIQCFKDRQFPCRWSKDLGKGFGYPLFNFYPPLIYVVPSLIHFLGFSIITSLNIFAFSTFLIAGFGMYLLGKAVGKSSAIGFLSSVLYTLYPFHAVNVFIRGVYAENFVWSLAPLILYVIFQSVGRTRFSRMLPLLISIVFLTHILSSFVMLCLIIFWTFVSAYYLGKPFLSSLLRVFVALIIGIGISSFFFIPAMIEKSTVQSETLISGYYSYFNHFVSLGQLFIKNVWNYGASLWGTPPEEMPFMVGIVHLILLALLTFYSVFMFFKKRSTFFKSKTLVAALILLLSFSTFLFLTHFKSEFIWKLIPPLQYYQFPWRFIAWAGIPLVISISLLATMMPRKIISFLVLAIALVLMIYSYRFFLPPGFDQIKDADLIEGRLRREQQVSNLYDYLPSGVKELPESYASSPLFTKYNGVEVYGSHRTSNVFSLELTSEEARTITLSQFYYPGWEGVVNNKKVELGTDQTSGLAQVYVPAGDSSILLKWVETPSRRLFDLLSVFFLFVYLIYIFWSSSKKGTFKLQ